MVYPKVEGSRKELEKVHHGEFDPGSGRTLAACLKHASRTEQQCSVANGCVTRKEPVLQRGIALGNWG
jgi:hypothetical protein